MERIVRTSIASAFHAIRNHRVRSLLTVLGVVIGVASITLLIALGKGLKRDVVRVIEGLGTNLLVILPGNVVDIRRYAHPAEFMSSDVLTLQDVEHLRRIPEVERVSPISFVREPLQRENKLLFPVVLGVSTDFFEAVSMLELERGKTFATEEAQDVIVIGAKAAKDLFGEADPLGKKVELGGAQLEVIGVFKKPKITNNVFGPDFGNLSVLPFSTATRINRGKIHINRIVVQTQKTADVEPLQQKIEPLLFANHFGKKDFSVITQENMLYFFTRFLRLSTALISSIAVISLIVGGISIMNIMLVTVMERTREIGLRKALGATKKAILIQFLVEAITITFLGGLLGLVIALSAGRIISVKTSLTPAMTAEVFFVAIGISMLIGVAFGLGPALRAANKDPIQALRSG